MNGQDQKRGVSKPAALKLLYSIVALGLAATGIGSASAQTQNTPSPVTSPVPTGPGIPRTGPDNAPGTGDLGMPLGSFRLYPTLDLRAGYDSNVFAVPNHQRIESSVFNIRPTLDLRSDWNNHMLNVFAAGAFGFYGNASSQNYQNLAVGADGRVDIQRDWYLTGKAAYRRDTEAAGTPNSVFQGFQTPPTVVNSVPVEIGMYQRFNRLFYQVNAGLTRYWYHDSSLLNPTVLSGSNRDRTEYGESLRAGYEVIDGVDLWLQGSLNQRRYDHTINLANHRRNSDGWNVQLGATADLGGISKLEGFVGYSQQNYWGSSSSTPAFIFGLAGIWNGYEPLILRPFVVRSINETAYTQYKSYISTSVGLEFLYTLYTGWQLNGGAAYTAAEYQPIDGIAGANAHTDTYWRGSLGLLYSVIPEVQVGPTYEFLTGSGHDFTSPNYNRHIVMLRLVLKK